MPRRRSLWDRWTASFKTAGAACCLLAVAAADSAPALDAGDGTVISPQPVRRPLDYETGKIVGLEGSLVHRFADKTELSVYQENAMHFGSLRKASGSVLLGSEDAIIADPDQLVFGGVTYSALIRLEGDPFRAVTIECSAPPGGGFQLSDFDTNLGPPPLSGQLLDGSGSASFQLGARLTLTVEQIAAGNDQEIAYTITAYYE